MTRNMLWNCMLAWLALIASGGQVWAQEKWMPDKLAVAALPDWADVKSSGCVAPGGATLAMFDRLKESAGAARAELAVCAATGDEARALPSARIEISPRVEGLTQCERAFVLGHELAHVALGHADFEAHYLIALAHLPTQSAADAMAAADYDLSLVFELLPTAQEDEYEADWVGALLAGTQGCSLDAGALHYFRRFVRSMSGQGLLPTHEEFGRRMERLQSWHAVVESVRANAAVMPWQHAELVAAVPPVRHFH